MTLLGIITALFGAGMFVGIRKVYIQDRHTIVIQMLSLITLFFGLLITF